MFDKHFDKIAVSPESLVGFRRIHNIIGKVLVSPVAL
jgi:hypothetical protein